MNIEEWAKHPDFPDYEVSSLGRVRRLTSRTRAKAGSVVVPARHYSGYWHYTLWRGGRGRTIRVNRLVCETFQGMAPTSKHHAAHLDGNKDNNRNDNLNWKTPAENDADKDRHGTRPSVANGRLTPESLSKMSAAAKKRAATHFRAKNGTFVKYD